MSRITALAALLLLGCQGVQVDTVPAGYGFEGCPAWSGLQVEGTWWHYRPHPEVPLDQDWRATVVSAEEEEEGLFVTVETHLTERGMLYAATQYRTHRYRCDKAGLWLVHEHVQYTQSLDDGLVEEGWYAFYYDEPKLLLAADVVPGDRWTSSWHWISETHQGMAGDASGTTTTEVIGPQEIEVPAGRFEALGLVRTVGSATLSPDWISEEIGPLTSAYHSTELVAYGEDR